MVTWLACLPGRDSHPLDYATLPGRTGDLTPFFDSTFLSSSQWENRAVAMKRLQALPERRNRKIRVRVAAKVPYGAKKERLAEKKSQRSGGGEED